MHAALYCDLPASASCKTTSAAPLLQAAQNSTRMGSLRWLLSAAMLRPAPRAAAAAAASAATHGGSGHGGQATDDGQASNGLLGVHGRHRAHGGGPGHGTAGSLGSSAAEGHFCGVVRLERCTRSSKIPECRGWKRRRHTATAKCERWRGVNVALSNALVPAFVESQRCSNRYSKTLLGCLSF